MAIQMLTQGREGISAGLIHVCHLVFTTSLTKKVGIKVTFFDFFFSFEAESFSLF
jgi:hypothetical protein